MYPKGPESLSEISPLFWPLPLKWSSSYFQRHYGDTLENETKYKYIQGCFFFPTGKVSIVSVSREFGTVFD